jgi:hypothetical protein
LKRCIFAKRLVLALGGPQQTRSRCCVVIATDAPSVESEQRAECAAEVFKRGSETLCAPVANPAHPECFMSRDLHALSLALLRQSTIAGIDPSPTILGNPMAKKQTYPNPAPAELAGKEVVAYEYAAKRKNNPEVGLVTPVTNPDAGKTV